MTHRDVWIFEDLRTIAIYYPEIQPEFSILNTQTVFVDYENASDMEKKNFLNLLGRSDYDLPGRCVTFLKTPPNNFTNENIDDIPKKYISGPDLWIKKMQQWKKFLTETKTKPGNVIFHPDFYDKVFHNNERLLASPIYDGERIVSFEYASWADPSITFKFRKNPVVIRNLNLDKFLLGTEDDDTARSHCPLSYFPTKIDFNSVLYNPSEKESERAKFISWYDDTGRKIADFCDNKNRKILYKDVVSTSGNLGYDLSIDLHAIGMDLKYDLPFESYLLKFLDPELFFVHKAQRVFFEKMNSDYGHLSNYGQHFHGDFKPRLLSQDKAGNARVEFNVVDVSIWNLKNPVEQLKVRDNYIQAFLAGFRIPIEPQDHRLDPADFIVLNPVDDYVSKRKIFVDDFTNQVFDTKRDGTHEKWKNEHLPQLYPVYLEHHDKTVLEIVGEIFEHAVSFAIRSLSGNILGAFIGEVSTIVQEQINKNEDIPDIIKTVSKVGFVELSSRFAAESKSKTSDKEKQKIETRKKIAEITGKVGHSWIVGQQDDELDGQVEAFAKKLLEEENEKIILILAEIANEKEKALSTKEKENIVSKSVTISAEDARKFLDRKKSGEGYTIDSKEASRLSGGSSMALIAAAIGLILLLKKK